MKLLCVFLLVCVHTLAIPLFEGKVWANLFFRISFILYDHIFRWRQVYASPFTKKSQSENWNDKQKRGNGRILAKNRKRHSKATQRTTVKFEPSQKCHILLGRRNVYSHFGSSQSLYRPIGRPDRRRVSTFFREIPSNWTF